MNTDDAESRVNPVVRAVLGLFAAPRIKMREDYAIVRRVQRLFARSPRRYRSLDRTIPAEDGSHDIPVRVFPPEERRHDDVLLFFHGGGWVTGDIDTYTAACATLSDLTGRVVLSVDYRLAPEHPFPAGLQDCLRVAELALLEPGLLGARHASQITLIGDSAGGNLAAAVSLRLRELGLPMPGGQILLYPATWFDHNPDTSPFESVRRYGTGLRLTAMEVNDYMELYEPDPQARRDPLVAPLLATDLSGQPATLVLTAELDLLRDEGEAYGDALQAAGNTVRIERIAGALHGFLNWPRFTQQVVRANQVINEFLAATQEASRQ